MNKIPTLFVRDPEDRARLLPEVAPGCAWVLAGEGRPTRKWDGTCVRFDGDTWWARREVKPGKRWPLGFDRVEHDPATGKDVGWEPAGLSAFNRYLHEALGADPSHRWQPGAYELVGPKVNGNPEGFAAHVLLEHGRVQVPFLTGRVWADAPTALVDLRHWLAQTDQEAIASGRRFEGIVWHHDDGRRAKLKVRAFASPLADVRDVAVVRWEAV